MTDCAFSPFNNNLLATTSEDGTSKLWLIPDEGIKQHVRDSDAELLGHTKKVMGCAWHRSADNILATHSADCSVRVWDVASQESTIEFPELGNIGTSMKWSPLGNKLAIVTKAADLYVFDPRVISSALKAKSHGGPKAQKLAWVDNDSFISCGFNKQAEREYFYWDTRNMAQPVASGALGDGLGVGHIYYDEEHNLLTVAGRGEVNIGLFAFDKSAPNPLMFITNYAS